MMISNMWLTLGLSIVCSVHLASSFLPLEDYDFMVAFHDTRSFDFLCAAAILNQRWMITSVQCIEIYDINFMYATVGLGTNYEIIPKMTSSKDIGLVQTKHPVLLNDDGDIIQLADASSTLRLGEQLTHIVYATLWRVSKVYSFSIYILYILCLFILIENLQTRTETITIHKYDG